MIETPDLTTQQVSKRVDVDLSDVVVMCGNANHDEEKSPDLEIVRSNDDKHVEDDDDGNSNTAEESNFIIVVPDIEHLISMNNVPPGTKLFVASSSSHDNTDKLQHISNPLTIIDEPSMHLNPGQTRLHQFRIQNDKTKGFSSITVTIVYRGIQTSEKYIPGKISASLCRLPPPLNNVNRKRRKQHQPSVILPQPLGVAPYHLQTINTRDHLGRIVIEHDPHQALISSGTFEILINAHATTRYTLRVVGTTADDAVTVLDRTVSDAVSIQSKLERYGMDVENMTMAIRLGENRVEVLKRLIGEADAESQRCECDIEDCDAEIENEGLGIGDETALDSIYRDIKILEMEFAHWCRLLSFRTQEMTRLKNLLNDMSSSKRQHMKEINELNTKLNKLQHMLPLAIATIIGPETAVNITREHLASVQCPQLLELLPKVTSAVALTPAEEVRRLVRREGVDVLTVNERRWCFLDQIVHPEKWKDDERGAEHLGLSRNNDENENDATGGVMITLNDLMLSPKVIERTKQTPQGLLTKKAAYIKHLLETFHDDTSLITNPAAAANGEYDVNAAARTRAKPIHLLSQEDVEWITIDRILNPGLWGKKKNNDIWSEYYQSRVQVQNNTTTTTTICDRWKCPLSRNDILRVWNLSSSSSDDNSNMLSNDERRTRNHLLTYNGTYQQYADMERAALERSQHAKQTQGRLWQVIRYDVDVRRRRQQKQGQQDEINKANDDDWTRMTTILKAIDDTVASEEKILASDVLHDIPQRYPRDVLLLELERELDRLITEQIYDQERCHPYLSSVERDDINDKDDAVGSADDDDVDDALEDTEMNVRLMEERAQKRVEKMLRMTTGRRPRGKQQHMGTVMEQSHAKEIEKTNEQENIGFGACLACRNNPCLWKKHNQKTIIDMKYLSERYDELSNELIYIQKRPSNERILQSKIPRSVSVHGGTPRFERNDLIHELTWEKRGIQKRMDLHNADRELHDAYATMEMYIEVTALHGYAARLATDDAVVSLERERDKLIASSVAVDIVDDILEWMLEGWHFGERSAPENAISGYVPSIKKDGFVKPGTDAIKARHVKGEQGGDNDNEDNSVLQIEKASDQKHNEATTGTPWERTLPIMNNASSRIEKERAIEKCAKRDTNLNKVEKTMKFGLFCITFMYFRALHLVRREKKSWSGQGDIIGGTAHRPNSTNTHPHSHHTTTATPMANASSTFISRERQKMMNEQTNAEQRKKSLSLAMEKVKRGNERRQLRQHAETTALTRQLHSQSRKRTAESRAAALIARVYRGHIGRKAARRWAMKRAEINAVNALLNGCAVTIERIWRGYDGRRRARAVRVAMTEFIAGLRADDAREEEEDYWRTHSVARWKRDLTDVVKRKTGDGGSLVLRRSASRSRGDEK